MSWSSIRNVLGFIKNRNLYKAIQSFVLEIHHLAKMLAISMLILRLLALVSVFFIYSYQLLLLGFCFVLDWLVYGECGRECFIMRKWNKP